MGAASGANYYEGIIEIAGCFCLEFTNLDGFHFIGACDQYWRSYGTSFTLASCGGDVRYKEGIIGLSCLCLQFTVMLAEVTLGAC